LWSYLFVINTQPKIKLVQVNTFLTWIVWINDLNKYFGLFKSQSGYKKIYYSQKIINAQTGLRSWYHFMNYASLQTQYWKYIDQFRSIELYRETYFLYVIICIHVFMLQSTRVMARSWWERWAGRTSMAWSSCRGMVSYTR